MNTIILALGNSCNYYISEILMAELVLPYGLRMDYIFQIHDDIIDTS